MMLLGVMRRTKDQRRRSRFKCALWWFAWDGKSECIHTWRFEGWEIIRAVIPTFNLPRGLGWVWLVASCMILENRAIYWLERVDVERNVSEICRKERICGPHTTLIIGSSAPGTVRTFNVQIWDGYFRETKLLFFKDMSHRCLVLCLPTLIVSFLLLKFDLSSFDLHLQSNLPLFLNNTSVETGYFHLASIPTSSNSTTSFIYHS